MEQIIGFFKKLIKGIFSQSKEASWAKKQILEMARLGGRLIV